MRTPRPVRCVLDLLATLVAAWAGVVWLTGGVVFAIGGLRVSSRSPTRPVILAALLLAAALWRRTTDERRAFIGNARRRGDRHAPWAAVVLALTVSAASAVFGVHVAGGSDASGYVSQSRLWSQGQLHTSAPTLPGVDWPALGWLVAPLGYAPSREGTLGPTYAPGLPWLMAAGAAVTGEGGRYVWTPWFVGVLTWGTFVMARRTAPPLVALAAATLVATSPPVLFAAMQTMSDLPGAALWLGALLALASPRAGFLLVSGTLAALAVVVRPNLAPVAGAVWAASLAVPSTGWRARSVRAALWAAPVAAGVAAVAIVNVSLWGSPATSGYGAPADLFATAYVSPNLARLWRWMIETRGYWCAIGLAALGWNVASQRARQDWPAAALVVAVLVCYLPYAVFEEWWYLRFYLPAWPVLASAATLAVWRVLARWSDDASVLVVMGLALAIGIDATRLAAAAGTFGLWRGEQRYASVAGFVHANAPDTAVVLAVQHSGSVSYYARRTIARFDYLAPDDLDALCARLSAEGRTTWLVLDDFEEPGFRQRFANETRGRLDWAPLGEARVGTARVRVYDLTTPSRATGPALIPVVTTSALPWTRIHRPAATK